MSDVKIFVIYHKPYAVFKNEVFEPIQTGADFNGIDLGFLKDNTGDNIAAKNPYYGELTAWYWVAHNWLPLHPEVKYVGFCHYRRFLNFKRRSGPYTHPYDSCLLGELEQMFRSDDFSAATIHNALGNRDILLSPKENFDSFRFNFNGNTVYKQYTKTHPAEDLDKAIRLYLWHKPDYKDVVQKFFTGSSFYIGLSFVMRRELFLDWEKWIISFLDELGGQCDWSRYHDYNDIRSPAFIAERFFNVWLEEKKREKGVSIREYRRWLVDSPSFPSDWPWYLSGVKQYILRAWERLRHPDVIPAVLQ